MKLMNDNDLIDKMDELGLWEDTVLVFSTDHGHLLGEHGYWAKNYMFDYKELVHIPLIVCAPGAPARRVPALTSTLDLMPTFLELHGGENPSAVDGRSLCHLLKADGHHHHAVLYGYFGKDINLTDGRYTYCRQPLPDSVAHHHTAAPSAFVDLATQQAPFVRRQQLAAAECGVFLERAHDIPHYRFAIPSRRHHNAPDFNPIYDIVADPEQSQPLRDDELEAHLAGQLRDLLAHHGAPASQYGRMGL